MPAFRRTDVTREADLIEEVARIDGAREAARDAPPGTAPRAAHRRQRLRRRAADALAAQGLHEVVGWSFVAPDLADRLRLPATIARSSSRTRCRPSTVAAAHDAARLAARRRRGATVPRGARRCALFEAGRGVLPDAASAASRRAPPRRRAAVGRGAARRRWREPAPRAADFFAAKGVLAGGCSTRCARRGRCSRGQQPFLHPGAPRAIIVGGGRSAGSARSIRCVARAVGDRATPSPRSSSTSTPSPAARTPLLRGRHQLPRGARGPGGDRRDDVAAADVLAVVRRAGAPLLAGAEVFDVYRDAQRIGDGNVSLALRLAYPRARPHADRRGGRRARATRSPRRWPTSCREGPCRLASPCSAPPGSPARWPRGCCTAIPRFELRAVTARSDVGRRLDDLYPHHRVPLTLEELDLDRHADGRRRDRRLPARRRGAAGRRAARARRQGRRPQRRLPPARPGRVRRVVPRAPGARADRARPSTACPSCYREQMRERCAGRQPRLLPDGDAAGAGAARPRGPDRGRGHRREVRASRARAAPPPTKTHFVTVDENVSAYGVPRHRHTPEIEQELGALGRRVRITFTPHWCRSTRASWCRVT